MTKDKPVIIPLSDQTQHPHPADIADVTDPAPIPTPTSPQQGRGLWGWIMGLILTCVLSYISLSAWDFATNLIARNMWLGWGFAALLGATGLAVIITVFKDVFALRRLKNVSDLKQSAADAITYSDPDLARRTASQIAALYRGRPDLQGAITTHKAMQSELVPLAMADVMAAFFINIRLIRNIAEIYAGRGGLFSSWRLLRSVMSHLITTNAVAIGDD